MRTRTPSNSLGRREAGTAPSSGLRRVRPAVVAAAVTVACFVDLGPARAADPASVARTTPERAAELAAAGWWETVLSEVPAMENELGDRWPMIVWHGPGQAPLPAERIQALLDRGITQNLTLDTNHIEAARALQEAGSKVIFMQGRAGNWPYSLAPDSSVWAHQFDEGYTYEEAGPGPLGQWHGACPLQHAGWAVLADQIRDTLTAFREAGVTVDGLWMDWEGDPYPFNNLFGQLRHCRRCRRQLPPEVLEEYEAWWDFYWRAYTQLHGAYVAGPAREIFPAIAVTNWHVVFSSRTDPLLYFVDDRVLPPLAPPLFTATNPVAYGNDTWWNRMWRDEEYELDRRHVDQFYMHCLLRGVSADAANRAAYGPQVMSFPWVTRFCPLESGGDDAVPDMSRAAYRECLRHLWLRDIDGMQLFNARWDGYEEDWVRELQDAVAVYDEILAHRELLAAGQAMNLTVPGVQDDGVLWSGLRSDDRAVVRAISQAAEPAQLDLEVWPGVPVELAAPVTGATYRIARTDSGCRVAEVR